MGFDGAKAHAPSGANVFCFFFSKKKPLLAPPPAQIATPARARVLWQIFCLFFLNKRLLT